jgi:hypothetical protein
VEVAVLAAVHVEDPRALAVAHPDRLRIGDLPVGRTAAGQDGVGPGGVLAALRLSFEEDLGLGRDHLVHG